MERVVAITGASSGLGLAFAKHYAAQPSTRVLALDVSPLPPAVEQLKNVKFYEVDVTDEEALAAVSKELGDLPVHISGIRGLVPSIAEEKKDVAAAETLEVMDKKTIMRTFEVNAWGAFSTIRTLLPHLQRAASYATTTGAHPPKVIVMSSRMGSVGANTIGGGYAYRTSKAALNAVIKSFSIDVKGVVFLGLHPGRVETGLVQWKEEGAISAEHSLEACLRVVRGAGLDDTGRFLDRFGKDIQW
ncbi:hypothetical protein N0V90_008483 [Kalmusia sp. IMI 367209]|nr:hypothetical protein N0V90_008483 [Kalmusia sp. IMI 367209]